MGFADLHPSVRYLVTEVMRFPALRPVQEMTIEPVLTGRDAVVLAPTAGGKTEAAMLPVLSRILAERWEPVPVLYVCPLKALLNNQEPRIERMARSLGLGVAVWHGDVASRKKKQARQEPPHVLMITPESLEVMLISPSDDAETFLSRVRVAVIDEVHAFASDARGAHLVAILDRLQRRAGRHVQRIGLSATVGDPEALAAWLQGADAKDEPVVVRPPMEPVAPKLRYRPRRSEVEAGQVLRQLGHGQKKLVFCQSRAESERLGKTLTSAGIPTWVHHSSVSRQARAEAEQAFELRRDAAIVATSSLELGIDIGDLDHVFQLDAPATVSSLAQRLGRTGRRAGTRPTMSFLCGGPEDLLLALALSGLFREGWVEAVEPSIRSWTVLVHQVFANVLETGGVTRLELIARLRFVPSFAGFDDNATLLLTQHLLANGYLDEVDGALVMGLRGEKEFGARHFFKLYAVFDSPESCRVLYGNQEIGSLQTWFALQLSGQRKAFRLAGKAWQVVEMDLKRRSIRVIPAADGLVPLWSGRTKAYGRKVCEGILDMLLSVEVPEGMDSTCSTWLNHARKLVEHLDLSAERRPIEHRGDKVVWHTFAGARINEVLARLLEHRLKLAVARSNLSVRIKTEDAGVATQVAAAVRDLREGEWPSFETWATFDPESRQHLLSQFQACLPGWAEQEFLRGAMLDVEGAKRWLSEGRFGVPVVVRQ